MENNKHPELPAIQISKGHLKILSKLITDEQAGKILKSLYLQIYEGKEVSFEEEYLSEIFESILLYVEDKIEKWYKRTSNFRNKNPKKKSDNQPDIQKDISSNIIKRKIIFSEEITRKSITECY